MRGFFGALLLCCLLMPLLGCDPPKIKEYDGPTVPKFVGRVLHEGKPVKFSDDEIVNVLLPFQKTGRLWTIPIQSDGSFDITWMPIGKYVAILERKDKTDPRKQSKYTITDDFRIEDGKTEYTFELGPDWKQ
jgi:hypothetical protein